MLLDSRICNKYDITKLLGNGKFGVVYEGNIIKTGETVAIKTEKTELKYKMLKHEVTILNYLFRNHCKLIPFIYWYGIHLNHTCIIMTYYSHSLQDYFNSKGIVDTNKLGSIMIKCIHILESIHKYFVIHRDIKPQNFMIKDGELYLIDFGLATFYIDEDNKHISKFNNEYVIGTPKYISYYNHHGDPCSRRDDLISLGYMYLYLQTGNLPWDNLQLPANTVNENIIIYNETHVLHPKNQIRKQYKSWSHLSCGLHSNIKNYLKYCYELNYDDVPLYDTMMNLFV